MTTIFKGNLDGRGRRFGIVVSRFSKVLIGGRTVGEVLLEGCLERLRDAGVASEDIFVAWVPGAFELPLAAAAMCDRVFEPDAEDIEAPDALESLDLDALQNGGNGHGPLDLDDMDDEDEETDEPEITIESEVVEEIHLDAVITLGCIIRGETPHFDFVASETVRGIGHVSLVNGIPVILGVLTCDTPEQALSRAGGAAGHMGTEAAEAALETASVHERMLDWPGTIS